MTLKNIIKGVLWFVGFASMVVLLYLALSFYVKNVSAASEVIEGEECNWMPNTGWTISYWQSSTDTGNAYHPEIGELGVHCVDANVAEPRIGEARWRDGCKLITADGQPKTQDVRITNPPVPPTPPPPVWNGKLYIPIVFRSEAPPPCDCAGHVCFVEINNRYVCEFPLLKDTWGVGTCDILNLNASNNDKAEVTCMWNGQYQSADPNWIRTEMDIKCPSKKVSRLCNNPAGYCGIIDCADLEGTSICETRITSTVCDLYCRGHFYIKDTP